MRRLLPLVAVGILLVGFVGVLCVTQATNRSPTSAEAPTNGEFVRGFAQSIGLANQSTSPSQALVTLRAGGMLGSEPINLDAPLTEGLVARLSQGVKLAVATNNPDREFSRIEANTYFSVFGTALAGSSTGGTGTTPGMVNGSMFQPDDVDHERNPNAADPRERGKGKKVGLSNHFPF
jgi:hypothetical protein